MPSGALRAFGRPVALVFHGVAREIEDPRLEINHLGLDDFVRIVKTLRANFDVLPLAALDDVMEQPERHPRAVFLTADDGYRNTLTTAADILADLRLPWSLFVSTRHIETGEPNPLFLARLFLYFAPAGRYDIPYLPASVRLDGARGGVARTTIRTLKQLEATKARESIEAMKSVFSEVSLRGLIDRFPSERFLTWSEVTVLAKRGVEIGAHAHWHWPLNDAQTPEHVGQQVRLARDLVKQYAGACRNFAYPFGTARDIAGAIWRTVRDAGFDHAFSTRSGTLDAGENPWLLPRYALTGRERNLAALLPLLRTGNRRLARWQRRLAA